MTSSLKLGLVGFIAGIVVFSTPSSSTADVKTWDQATVTSLAQQLVPTSEAFWEATRRQPGERVGLQSKSRTLTEMTQGLAAHLAKGDGFDKTVDMYKTMKEVVDDILEAEEFAEMIEPTTTAWANFMAAMKQIAPYYDPKGASDIQP